MLNQVVEHVYFIDIILDPRGNQGLLCLDLGHLHVVVCFYCLCHLFTGSAAAPLSFTHQLQILCC